MGEERTKVAWNTQGEDLEVIVRTWAFILSDMRNHHRVLNRRIFLKVVM